MTAQRSVIECLVRHPHRLWKGLLLCFILVVAACGVGPPTIDESTSGWSVIMEQGERGHGPDAYWSARLVAADQACS